jgi:hypothetical protein
MIVIAIIITIIAVIIIAIIIIAISIINITDFIIGSITASPSTCLCACVFFLTPPPPLGPHLRHHPSSSSGDLRHGRVNPLTRPDPTRDFGL